MPRKGHSEEQIVYAMRQVEAGKKVTDVCREMGCFGTGLLQLEAALCGCRRQRTARTARTAAITRRESPTENVSGRPDAGQAYSAGSAVKKSLRPAISQSRTHTQVDRLEKRAVMPSNVKCHRPLYAIDLYADLSMGIIGVLGTVLLLAPMSWWLHIPLTLACACTFGLLSLLVIVRSVLDVRWVVRATRAEIILRLWARTTVFEPALGLGHPRGDEIITIDIRDVESISIRRVDVQWSSVRTTTIQYLCLGIRPCARGRLKDNFLRVGAVSTCSTRKVIVTYADGEILVDWLWRPGLSKFVQKLKCRLINGPSYPSFVDEQKQVVDASKFGSISEWEQQALMARLVHLGLWGACVLMLRRYKSMSLRRRSSISVDLPLLHRLRVMLVHRPTALKRATEDCGRMDVCPSCQDRASCLAF